MRSLYKLTLLLVVTVTISCSSSSNKNAESIPQDSSEATNKIEIAENSVKDSLVVKKLLPVFDSVSYMPLETTFDFNFKAHKALSQIKHYDSILYSIPNGNVYYVHLKEEQIPGEIKQSFVNLSLGFIIIHNTELNQAKFINVENDFYIDALINLTFDYLGKGLIIATETITTDGEYDNNGELLSNDVDTLGQQRINISYDGSVSITNKQWKK